MHGGIGKDLVASQCQAAGMVGMDVGNHDIIDLIRVIARGNHVGRKFAKCRSHQIAGSRIEQYKTIPEIQQIGIDRKIGWGALKRTGKGQAGLFGRGVHVKIGDRELGRTVRKGGDFDIADHDPVIARCLCANQRCLCLCGQWHKDGAANRANGTGGKRAFEQITT